MAGPRKLFNHLNNAILCAISIKTTGYTPFYHNLISIAVIPLDVLLNPDKRYSPFFLDIIPNRPENIEWDMKDDEILNAPSYANIDNQGIITTRSKIAEISAKGVDPYKASDLFENWFEKLELRHRKKIAPLVYDWKFSAPFIMDWLGGPLNMDYIFDSKYRDIASTALFLNDYADAHHRETPYPKIHLKYLCSQLKIIHEHRDDAIADCMIIREIYSRMLRDAIIRENSAEIID